MKYVIIGAVAGGASAAARLRRLDEHAEIVIFERGAYISYANCGLPYYIGNVIRERDKLFVQTAADFRKRFNVDVRVKTEVISINRDTKTVSARDLVTGRTYSETYDKLILSPGAEPLRPPLPGIDMPGIFTLRNVADTDYIKQYADSRSNGKAVIIGAGFIGLEMAENLHHIGMHVTVIEMGSQVLAPLDRSMAAIVQEHILSKGVDLLLDTRVTGFVQEGSGISVQTGDGKALFADIIIMSAGVRPDTHLAKEAGLATGRSGGIIVDEFLRTSDADIYAVGDAIEFANPITGQSMPTYLAGPANKQGRMCADNAALGNVSTWRGAINTAIVKVFDMTVGVTGVASKHLAAAGIDHFVSTTHSGSNASYYPGAEQMTIQLAVDRNSRVLGAQVVGHSGVDKRTDIFAGIVQRGGTISDLTSFEHAYAPPFSSAKDPVNIAGFVAENILLGKMTPFYWDGTEEITKRNLLVDVRTRHEYLDGAIDGAINIPLDELRERMHELPPEEPVYLYCEGGTRGYLAQRILNQNGYKEVYNLSGGYKLWKSNTSNHTTKNKTIAV